nr:MAG TPA: hypothetical protein [Caudoviricetes sp.]
MEVLDILNKYGLKEYSKKKPITSFGEYNEIAYVNSYASFMSSATKTSFSEDLSDFVDSVEFNIKRFKEALESIIEKAIRFFTETVRYWFSNEKKIGKKLAKYKAIFNQDFVFGWQDGIIKASKSMLCNIQIDYRRSFPSLDGSPTTFKFPPNATDEDLSNNYHLAYMSPRTPKKYFTEEQEKQYKERMKYFYKAMKEDRKVVSDMIAYMTSRPHFINSYLSDSNYIRVNNNYDNLLEAVAENIDNKDNPKFKSSIKYSAGTIMSIPLLLILAQSTVIPKYFNDEKDNLNNAGGPTKKVAKKDYREDSDDDYDVRDKADMDIEFIKDSYSNALERLKSMINEKDDMDYTAIILGCYVGFRFLIPLLEEVRKMENGSMRQIQKEIRKLQNKLKKLKLDKEDMEDDDKVKEFDKDRANLVGKIRVLNVLKNTKDKVIGNIYFKIGDYYVSLLNKLPKDKKSKDKLNPDTNQNINAFNRDKVKDYL